MKIKVNNSLIYFDVANPGLILTNNAMHELPTLIVLHGGPGYDHTPYKGFLPNLENTCQIIYIDQHGNGKSDKGSPQSWNFERWTNDIYQFCQLLNIKQPIIFGHSFGSMVALEFAIRYSKNLSKLILCNAIAKFDIQTTAQNFYNLGGEKSKNAFLNFLTDANDSAKLEYSTYCTPYYSVKKIDEQAIFYNRLRLQMDILIYFYTNIITNFDCTNKIDKIEVPTLILSGEKDPIATIDMANKIAISLNKNCYNHYIAKNTSHNLIWESPDEISEQIKSFIQHA